MTSDYLMQNLNDYDRVRNSTSPSINKDIDNEANTNIEYYGQKSIPEIKSRIETLDKEWDIERVLEVNASTLALTGLLLGMMINKKWLALPAVVLPFLLQHGLQGWCPPLPILRRMNIRTRNEIDREKYALIELINSRN